MDKTASFQDAAAIPLFIGVDEEGGTVARASRNPNLFEKKFRSPREVYLEIEGGDGIRADAIEKSTGLLSYGINVNFAPVADVSTDPADFIYARTYGLDAEQTAFFVGQTVEEMTRLKTGSVLKHFPGYGSNADTHTGIAVDVTDVDDTPGSEKSGTTRLGKGAAVKVMDSSVICHPEVVARLEDTAKAQGIPVQRDIMRAGGTDAGAIHTARMGACTGGISIPCRYIHTPAETAGLRDAAACVRLTVAFAQQ